MFLVGGLYFFSCSLTYSNPDIQQIPPKCGTHNLVYPAKQETLLTATVLHQLGICCITG